MTAQADNWGGKDRLRLPQWMRRRPTPYLVAAGVVLSMIIVLSSTYLILSQRQRDIAGTRQELESLALILGDQAERSFQSLELVQTGLVEQLARLGSDMPDALAAKMGSQDIHQELHDRIAGLPQVQAITLIDRTGRMVNDSRVWPVLDTDLSGREDFKALTGGSSSATFIGKPVLNEATGHWTLSIARRIPGSDGQSLGVVLGSIELRFFENFYGSFARSGEHAIALMQRDGVLLARFPPIEAEIGRSFASSLLFDQRQPGATTRFVQQRSLIDGVDRFIALRDLARYPLTLGVGVSVSTAMESWSGQARSLTIAALLLVGGIAGLVMFTLRQLRDQDLLASAAAGRAQAGRIVAEAKLALVQEREQAGRARRTRDLQFAIAVENMVQGLCMFDARGHLLVVNQRFGQMFRLSPAALRPGTPVQQIIAAAIAAGSISEADGARVRLQIAAPAPANAVSAIWTIADGRSLAVSLRSMPDDNGWIATCEDVTERRLAEQRIAHMARHDALTNLPNRVLLRERLDQVAARARRGDTAAVLCLDLDHFKAVNDTLGHPVGDALLQDVTARLLRCVRETDTVARLGGDEFAVVQTAVNQPQDATTLATRLVEEISMPYSILGHTIVIGVSIGIAMAPEDGTHGDDLLKNADLALYRAKADGRGRFRFFETEMDARMQARRELELDLRRALPAGELRLLYQPVVSLPERNIVACEALLRWQHPVRGLLGPEQFVPLAEEIGLIGAISAWALREACAEAVRWPGHARVAVNISALQFHHPAMLIDMVEGALHASGLAPSRLELEVTEHIMLRHPGETLETLRSLKQIGVAIAMDDFGMGYSCLASLGRFPFDKVKIGQYFVEHLGEQNDCTVIVHAIAGLCANLGLAATAEGVTNEQQLLELQASNCGEVQGSLFGPPLPPEGMLDLFRVRAPSLYPATPRS